MAFLALGRLRSHPGLETGLRTRFHDSPTTHNSSEQTVPRWQEIRPKGRPVEPPYPQRTNQRTKALQQPLLLFTKTQIQFRNFLSPEPEPSSGRRITPNPHRSAALTIKSCSDAHFHSPISISSASYENASRAQIRKYNRHQKRGRAGSLRHPQRTSYLGRLRRWPVAGAFQWAPIGVKPVTTTGDTLHQDDVVQYHRNGQQARQRMPATTVF